MSGTANQETEVSLKEQDPLILVVEDDERTLKLLGQVLRRGGYKSALAKSGLGAVQLLKRAVPSLILLDLKMEPMDGFELLTLLKKYPASASIPVVVLTGRDSPQYIDRSISFGVVDYLIKPIQPRDLLRKVQAVLADTKKSTA